MINRIKGGLYGLLIGDALGVPYEFHAKQEIPPYEQIEMTPPKGFDRSHGYAQIGAWSDDGSQALCLLDSLMTKNTLDIEDFTVRMINWLRRGYMAANGFPYGVGLQTLKAFEAYLRGVPPTKSGMIVPEGKGNGALMRVLPLALWHRGSDEELVKFAHEQCLPTHGNITNQVCCALYCLVAKSLLNGDSFRMAFADAVTKLRKIYQVKQEYSKELESLNPDAIKTWEGKGGGYIVDCLKSAFMIMLKAKSYEQAVKMAVALGNDTDTTACVTGGLAGIVFGYDKIPTRWVDSLQSKEIVENITARLLAE